MKITKKAYLHGFTLIVMVLALVRFLANVGNPTDQDVVAEDSLLTDTTSILPIRTKVTTDNSITRAQNRILSVANYDTAFPDLNDVQLESAQKLGVQPVANRADAEKRKHELVYVGANPYYTLDKLRSSIPYLIPRAAVLLQDIGKAYYDSLDMKGVPLHTIIATSILRTKEDVEKLRVHNHNATENSCHLYGTTFDIAQNRFQTVEDPKGPHRRAVTNDTLKWVLSEVLRDMREQGRCYVKYEKKQGCFHISVR